MKQIPEKVNTGGLTGQGFSNLLGRPRLGPLPLVIREAVQNSWDARWRRGTRSLRFTVRVRDLALDEEKAFRKIFDQSDSIEPRKSNVLARLLREETAIRVLELADFGTVGLCGTTRPDLPGGDLPSRFVNFFFDIGRSHEESGDGGTYGFGRSSLYTAGKSALILVDSLADESGQTERRLMACRIGDAFDVAAGGSRGRYSGRHFWGKEKGGIAQPLIGSEAERLAERLGLPGRSSIAQTGTTVLIPWPADDFNTGDGIARTILHHLWPKMIDSDGYSPIRFSVEVDGRKFAVPDPATSDEYRLFVRALKVARTRKAQEGARIITTLRPRHETGSLGMAIGTLANRVRSAAVSDGDDDDGGSFESPLNSIALMRPSELVVRYLPVSGTELVDRNWAGVFICGDTTFVRTSFARSEPPAHDDWIADRLSERHERYIVRKTVQSLLPEAVRDALGLGISGEGIGEDGGASLAGVSSRFSSAFLTGDGQGPSIEPDEGERGGRGSIGSSSRRRTRISPPVVVGLEQRGGVRVATFRIPLSGRRGARVTLRAIPAIHADDALDEPPIGIEPPTILGWHHGLASGDLCEIALEEQKVAVDLDVAFRGEYGVTLACAVVSEEAE